MRTTITETYEEVKDKITVSKKCTNCGKIIVKVLSEFQTINPWNQKSRLQIHQENREKLKKAEVEWHNTPEVCSTCAKLDIPDIDIDLIDEEFWKQSEKLRQEIAILDAKACSKRKELNEIFKGKHITVKYKGKPRIGQITDISTDFGTFIHYDILRSDGKGFIDENGYTRPEVLWKKG